MVNYSKVILISNLNIFIGVLEHIVTLLKLFFSKLVGNDQWLEEMPKVSFPNVGYIFISVLKSGFGLRD